VGDVALVSEECTMAEGAVWFRRTRKLVGLFGFDVIGAVQSFADGAPFAIAGMIFTVVVVVAVVAFVAKVRFAEEPAEGIAAVVVAVLLDEKNALVQVYGSRVNNHVWQVDGQHLDLVPE